MLLLCPISLLLFVSPTLAQQQYEANVAQASVIKAKSQKSLSGVKIVINPGHGGEETGAVDPTGYFASYANLKVSKLLAAELRKYGAIVVMTRDNDKYLSLSARQEIINQEQPTIAVTIHYTFAEDYEDAEQTKGIRAFWYHPQSKSLAVFIHNYLTRKLGRAEGGVFWNNLALTRPEVAPSVVLELGFFSNPEEFEWITNNKEQTKLASTLALSIVEWFKNAKK
ncbi:N-acetylmuramoyl-L-alanine amidase family protein [Dulcicalothrix desertica]|uniref:N-acetylmuramoyl-L-alanine amidase family protein n=1 Tax=Dulcicalothrix desertica TaxID=32056 RepID=UPI001F42C386|nr:N-acetylmuramoyl-L-alanine amidase [Dulcicalothrix desertica]